MASFYLTHAAEQDMLSIGRYTEDQWGREQRNLYLTELDEGFTQIATMPGIGQDCRDIRPGYRKYPVRRHIIFYRVIDDDTIEIVRVLHERMDSDAQLLDE